MQLNKITQSMNSLGIHSPITINITNIEGLTVRNNIANVLEKDNDNNNLVILSELSVFILQASNLIKEHKIFNKNIAVREWIGRKGYYSMKENNNE